MAYSSQLVDRAIAPINVVMNDGSEFLIQPTHHFGFWDKRQELEVWLPFHFFPAAKTAGSLRKDGRVSPYAVAANSAPVKELLIEALKSRNLYRIGIALHTYADSWAHQNFIGQNSIFNRVLSLSPIPPVGHAHFGSTPDVWGFDWIDGRLVPEYQVCSNFGRFMAAAEKTYKYLATFNGRSFGDWKVVRGELLSVILDEKAGAGVEGDPWPRKNDVFPDAELELEFRLKLDGDVLQAQAWFKDAGIESESFFAQSPGSHIVFARQEIQRLLKIRRPVLSRGGELFRKSHLYQWALAAEEHRGAARRIIKQL